jgi:hypothetical protein
MNNGLMEDTPIRAEGFLGERWQAAVAKEAEAMTFFFMTADTG